MKKLFAVFSLLAVVLFGVQFASAATDTCINLTQDMGIGSTDANSGGQVSILQNYLNSKGYIKFKTDSTGAIIGLGNFGAQTARAVMSFQKAYSIAQSGYVGPITRSNIQSLTCAVGVAQTYVNNITETPATMSTSTHSFLTFSSPKNGDLVIKGEKDLSVDWTIDPNVTTVFPADRTRINADLIGTDGQVMDFVGHGVSLANSKGDRRISGNFQGTLRDSMKSGGNHNAGDPIPNGGYKIRASLVYTPSMPLCTTTVTHGCVTSYSAADQALIDLAKTYGSDSQWFYITNPAPKPNIQTSISDRTIPTSQPVTISWSSNQASTNCKFTDVIASTTVSILASGSKTVTPFASTSTYKISCDLTSEWPFPGLTYTTTEEKSMRVFVANGVVVPVLNRITPRDGNTKTIFTIYGKNLGGVTNVQLYSASGTLAQSLAPSSVSSTELTFQVKNRNFASGIYSVGVTTSACGAGCSNDRVSITFDGRDNACSGTSTDASCNTMYNCNGVISHDPCTSASTNTNNSIAQVPACPDSTTGCGSFGCPDSTNCQPLPCPTTGSCGTTSLSTNQIKVTNTKLSMTYGLASEASLGATSQVDIQAGNVKVDIAKPGYFQSSMSMFSLDLYKSSDEWANVSGSMISVKASGDVIDNGTSWSVSPGKRATFMLTKSYNPKLLFAGMYYAKASVISSGSVNLANSKSNTVNVFGEESPYISSAVQNGDGTITVTGARLNLVDNYLQIDGMGNSMISKFNPTATSFTFNASNYQLSSGYHTMQITNARTGNSNFVGVSNTVTSFSVTARAVSGPSIALRYDSSSKESSLIGTASVQINAGASNLTIIKQNVYVGDQTGVGFFAGTATNSAGGNSTGGVMSVKQSDTGATEQSDRWIIPAGKSATFTVTTTFNPKIMFAGSYHFVPGFYIGNSGIGNILSAKDGNSVTIVGEISPYISSAAVDSTGQVTIVGQRLNLAGNTVYVDGNNIGYPIFKATQTTITFNVSAYNIGSGTHTLQVRNSTTGDSNYAGILVSNSPNPTCNSEQTLVNGQCVDNTFSYTCLDGKVVQVPAPALPSESFCSSPSTGIVSISSLSPSSGPTGTTVTINGSRFTSSNNTILMDYGSNSWYKLADKLTSNGTTLTVTIPTYAPCPTYRSGGVGCPTPSPLTGTHTIYVVNSSGISNGKSFTVGAASEPVTTTSYNFVAGTKDSCESSIMSRFGVAGTCTVGGGCTINGNIPSATYPSANPNLWGACYLSAPSANVTRSAPTISNVDYTPYSSTQGQITITGSGFDAANNTVVFANSLKTDSTQLSSTNNGTKIYTSINSVPGATSVRVTTGAGTSNTATFTVSENSPAGHIGVYANANTGTSTNCFIALGANSCNVDITWATENVPTAEVTKTPRGGETTVVSNLLSSDRMTVSVGQGSTMFTLSTSNGGTILGQANAKAYCESGLVWSDTTNTCQPSSTSPVPSATLSQSSLTTNQNVSFTLRLSSKNATSCSVSYTGPDGGGVLSEGPTSGSMQVAPGIAGTYKAFATCTGPGGVANSNTISHTVKAGTGMVLGATAECTDLAYNFHRGNESLSTKKLQSFLISSGYMEGDVTGFYGDMTVSAVKEYQGAKGLPVTGMVYDATRAAIKAETCGE